MQNFVQEGDILPVVVTSPAVPAAGDAVRFNLMTGIAALNEGEGGCAATETMVAFKDGVYDLSVTDSATGGIAVGDALWLHDGSPPTIDNVSTSGYFFGFALEAVSDQATATINVLHKNSPGSGTLGSGSVGTTQLAADSVTNNILANITRGSIKVGGASNAPTDLNAKTSGYILVGDGTDLKSVAVSGDALLSAAGAVNVVKLGVSPKGTVVPNASTGNIASGDLGKIHTNTGSSGTVVLTLPAVSGLAGSHVKVAVTAAQIIQVMPQTGEKIYLNGSGVATKYLNIAAVVGNFADLYCDGTDWMVLNYAGVVTKEA